VVEEKGRRDWWIGELELEKEVEGRRKRELGVGVERSGGAI
jgi:hypothetical protein